MYALIWFYITFFFLLFYNKRINDAIAVEVMAQDTIQKNIEKVNNNNKWYK